MAACSHAAERVFPALEALSRTMVSRHRGDRPQLDLDSFEDLSDYLIIVRTKPRFGEFRVEFLGSVVAEIGPCGDTKGAEFGDLLPYPFYQPVLKGYRHGYLLGLPTVTRNYPLAAPFNFFSRLIIPIFSGNRAEFLVGAVVPHEQPLGYGS